MGYGCICTVSVGVLTLLFLQKIVQGSATVFNHVGDGLVVTRTNETDPIIRALSFPGFELLHTNPSHVGGCMATALDPRGRYVLFVSGGDVCLFMLFVILPRYLASGGNDSIVNLFDLSSDWICARTITVCECVAGHLSSFRLYLTVWETAMPSMRSASLMTENLLPLRTPGVISIL